MHKLLQTSWTAFFGAVAALESIVLVWWSEKIYKVWSRIYLFIVTRLPWGNVDAEVEPVSVAPKGGRRQPAIDARDACYNLLDA